MLASPSPAPTAPHEVLRLAEELNTHLPLRPTERRRETPRYVLCQSAMPGPYGTVIQRLRLPDAGPALADAVSEVRALLRQEGVPAATWEVGPSSTPDPEALCLGLQALGMVPAPDPVAAAMVLCEAPRLPMESPPGEAPLRVERATTLADFRSGQELLWQCFGFPPDEAALAAVEVEFRHAQSAPDWQRYLAWQGEQLVAAADAIITPWAMVLGGGATLPEARGRGAYRALLAARWQEAQRRGTPWIVIQAGAMSRPILQRLGFQEVALVRIFVDELRE